MPFVKSDLNVKYIERDIKHDILVKNELGQKEKLQMPFANIRLITPIKKYGVDEVAKYTSPQGKKYVLSFRNADTGALNVEIEKLQRKLGEISHGFIL